MECGGLLHRVAVMARISSRFDSAHTVASFLRSDSLHNPCNKLPPTRITPIMECKTLNPRVLHWNTSSAVSPSLSW
eukprot:904750-Prorocentrum_minimum.AAC.1